ncbi:MAG: hypothetical protein R3E89_07560 [Thiolinea sp.]
MDVRIVDFKQTLIAVLEHRDAGKVNNTVKRFIDWRKRTGLSPVGSMRTSPLLTVTLIRYRLSV